MCNFMVIRLDGSICGVIWDDWWPMSFDEYGANIVYDDWIEIYLGIFKHLLFIDGLSLSVCSSAVSFIFHDFLLTLPTHVRVLTLNVSHDIFCNLLKRLLLLLHKKYSRVFGDISEILSELNLRTMPCNNGRTKNDRYQKTPVKGTGISTKHTYVENGWQKLLIFTCVRMFTPKGLRPAYRSL